MAGEEEPPAFWENRKKVKWIILILLFIIIVDYCIFNHIGIDHIIFVGLEWIMIWTQPIFRDLDWVLYVYYFTLNKIDIEFPIHYNLGNEKYSKIIGRRCQINDKHAHINSICFRGHDSLYDTDETLILQQYNEIYFLYHSREYLWCLHDKNGQYCGIYCHHKNWQIGKFSKRICLNTLKLHDLSSDEFYECNGIWHKWEYKIYGNTINNNNTVLYHVSIDWKHINNSTEMCDVRNTIINHKKRYPFLFVNGNNTYFGDNKAMIKLKYKGKESTFYYNKKYQKWCLQDMRGIYCNTQIMRIQALIK